MLLVRPQPETSACSDTGVVPQLAGGELLVRGICRQLRAEQPSHKPWMACLGVHVTTTPIRCSLMLCTVTGYKPSPDLLRIAWVAWGTRRTQTQASRYHQASFPCSGEARSNLPREEKTRKHEESRKKYPKLCSFGVFRGVVQQTDGRFSICTSTRPFLCFLCLTQLFPWLDWGKTLIL